MTVNELYRQGAEMLDYAFIENAFFDARWLMEHALKINSTQFALKKDKEVKKKDEIAFLSLIRRRIAGEPLSIFSAGGSLWVCRLRSARAF